MLILLADNYAKMPIIFLVILILILLSCLSIVQQNTVYVVEFLGRFSRTMTAGLNFKIPFLERIADKVTLRQQNFAIKNTYPSKDKVIVDISTNLIFEVDSTEEGVKKYTYSLVNRNQSIGAIIENSLRTYVAKETHEGILEKKDELATHIRNDLEKQFSQWGMLISSFQITEVSFPATITQAMSEVVASEQLKRAAENKGEATKIQSVKEAEAEKERKRLQGEGLALERAAIAQGLQQSIEIVKQATGQDEKHIIALLTLTQYLDTMKTIGVSSGSKVIFMDSSAGKTKELTKEIIAAFES